MYKFHLPEGALHQIRYNTIDMNYQKCKEVDYKQIDILVSKGKRAALGAT